MRTIGPGSRSFGSRIGGRKRVGLACVALCCGFAAPAASKPQDGSWTGTTGQGRVYNFTVKGAGTAINPLQVGYTGGGCSGTTTFMSDIAIAGNAFSADSYALCPRVETSGTFTSTTTASGTAKFTWTYIPNVCWCSGTVSTTWTATKAPPQADLAVSKDDGKTTVVAGSSNTYTITVTNNGPEAVSSLTLTDTATASLLNPVFTPATGTYNPATGAWTGLSLGSGQSVTMTMTATLSPAAVGTVTNTASVSPPAGVSDPTPSNNTVTDTDSVVVQADVSVTKTGPGVLTPPTGVTWRITVTNNGPSDATGVQVADATPSGLTFVSNAGACTSAFPCNLGAIPAGQSRTIDATYSVPAGFSTPATVDNTATVTATSTDPDLTDNTATITSQVVPPGPPSSFFTIEPCRLLDTRAATGDYGGPALVAGADRTFVATGPRCGIPATAKAISVNVTVTVPTIAGNLRLYPGGQPLPQASTVNYSAGQTRANNAIVPLNGSGEFTIRCAQASGTAHAVVDVNGYYE